MVSPSSSTSSSSSAKSPPELRQALGTHPNAGSTTYYVATTAQTKLPAMNAATVPPCPCDELQIQKTKTKGLPSSLDIFGPGNHSRVDGSTPKTIRQLRPLRHPTETGDILQKDSSFDENTRLQQYYHVGFEGKPQRAQVPDNTAHRQATSPSESYVISESEGNGVEQTVVAQKIHGQLHAAVNAPNSMLSKQFSSQTCLSYSHGPRPEVCTSLMRDCAASKSHNGNLLRSVSADQPSKHSFRLVSAVSHSHESQIGTAGTQKQNCEDCRAAACCLFKSPAVENPSQPAEKSRGSYRIVLFSKGPKRKGEPEKTEHDAKINCEGEHNCNFEAPSTRGVAGGATVQAYQYLPEHKSSSHCYHARWSLEDGKSPAVVSPAKPQHVVAHLASASRASTGCPSRPLHATSSSTPFFSRDMDCRPHIVVRSYKTFQQECAKQCRLRKPEKVASPEDIPKTNAPGEYQKRACMGGAGACLTGAHTCSSNECETSRGTQRQLPFGSKTFHVSPSTSKPSNREEYSAAEKYAPEQEERYSSGEECSQNCDLRSACNAAERDPKGPLEKAGYFEEPCHVLPRRLPLKRLLGSGAMGRVYLLELNEQPYAVKIAVQNDPAACMYLKQGWRNLVHLEKIHQKRLRYAATRTTAPVTNTNHYQGTPRSKDALRYASACSSARQDAVRAWRWEARDVRELAAVGRSPLMSQTSAKDGRESKQLIGRDIPPQSQATLVEKLEPPEGNVTKGKTAATLHNENLVGLQRDVQDNLSLHTDRQRSTREDSPPGCKSVKQRRSSVAFPPVCHSGPQTVPQEARYIRRSVLTASGRKPLGGAEELGYGVNCKAGEPQRYFCRPVAFLEGDWFPLEAQQPEAPGAATARLKPVHVAHLQKTCVGQNSPPAELTEAQQLTAGIGPGACFASQSSRDFPLPRKQKHGRQTAVEQEDIPSSTCAPVPVCAYIMEYIPDACQLTAVIWNLHRCLDPSRALRRDCHKSLVAQRLVEIGLQVAEAHKRIASEAGLYSFDFNPKNILVSVVARRENDKSADRASTTRMATARSSGSPTAPLAAHRSTIAGITACRRQKQTIVSHGAAAILRPTPPQAEHLPCVLERTTRRQRQEQKELHLFQQRIPQQLIQQQYHGKYSLRMQQQQHYKREQQQQQHAQANLTPAEITRMVLCEPHVSFRVVAIDLDCSLQAPFSSSAATLSSGSPATDYSASPAPSSQTDALAPLLDWSCGRRVVYSCPHVSSITAAYIVAVLAKNKGEGQFTRSGLSEAAAHAALCCRIDDETNFLHYLWAPMGRKSSKSSEEEENTTRPDVEQAVSTMCCTREVHADTSAAAQICMMATNSIEQPFVRYKEEGQRPPETSGHTKLQEKCGALSGRQHLSQGITNRGSSFCAPSVPAEASVPTSTPPYSRPSLVSAGLQGLPLVSVCGATCSPRKEQAPALPTIFSGNSSSQRIPPSQEQPSTGGSTNSSTCREDQGGGTDRPFRALAHQLKDCRGCNCTEQLPFQSLERPDTTFGSSRRNSSSMCREHIARLEPESGDSLTCQRAEQTAREHHDEKVAVQGAYCNGTASSPSCSPAAATMKQATAEKHTNPFMPPQEQLYLPCFLYPRWGPKTPRGICQKDYKRYGVKLVGQHVNLQLLAFILCELLDFRSLHVVVLQRFGLELRALHLPTGICQMFSEQDQIISCLCFSALTRMTSAVIPPLRVLSLASAKLSPSRMLAFLPAQPIRALQRRCALPLHSFKNEKATPACGCQQVQKVQDKAKQGYSSSQENCKNDDINKKERGEASAISNERIVVPIDREKCCCTGWPALELAMDCRATVVSAANKCTALSLLPPKPAKEQSSLLCNVPATEGYAYSGSDEPGEENLPEGGSAIDGSQADIGAVTVERSPSSSSSTTAGVCPGRHQQGNCDNLEKGESCSGSRHCIPVSETLEKGAGKEVKEDGSTRPETTQIHQNNQASSTARHIFCGQQTRHSRPLSRHKRAGPLHHELTVRARLSRATANTSTLRCSHKEVAGAETASSVLLPSEIVGAAAAATAHSNTSLRHPEPQRWAPIDLSHGDSRGRCRPEVGPQAPVILLQQQQEEWSKAGEKSLQHEEAYQQAEGFSFRVCVGNQQLTRATHVFGAQDIQETPRASEALRLREERTRPLSVFPFEKLRHQRQLQHEQAQQEQQLKVRRLMPEDVSRMSVWEKVEQLPALNPHDFLPPLHIFGTSCMQEVAALNAVLLQFLDPHPFFALRYSSSASAFDRIISALRQLKRRLASLQERPSS